VSDNHYAAVPPPLCRWVGPGQGAAARLAWLAAESEAGRPEGCPLIAAELAFSPRKPNFRRVPVSGSGSFARPLSDKGDKPMSEHANKIRIKAILETWADAVRRHDVLAILAHHEPDIVTFDLPPPLQCKGIEAYKETWDLLLARHRQCY
jgi:hypothetical protein